MNAPLWHDVRRLLAIRLDNVGDVLMTSPALALLASRLPQARVTLLASPSGAALQPFLEGVHDAIAYDAPWVASSGVAGDLQADLAFAQQLRERAFDAAVIFTVCTQSALPAAMLCRLGGIPRVLAHCRENPYRLVSHWVRDDERPGPSMRHEVRRQLDLLAEIGLVPSSPADERLRFALRDGDAATVQARLRMLGVQPHERYLVLHPGATAPSRRYPPESFAAAATQLVRDGGLRIVLVGTAADAPALAQVERALPAHTRAVSLAGALDLGELAALISQAAVVLCNNSAAAHLSAAVGTPAVVAYALTNPQHTPWAARARVLSHDVPCRNCLRSVCPQVHHRCLREVAPEQMASAALSLLAEEVTA
jgi:lipopolysaccharide heptosyltransferase II